MRSPPLPFSYLISNRVASLSPAAMLYFTPKQRPFLQLMDELRIRLGHLGWAVEEIIHDDERHPCELVQELAGADILLTAHGFQVRLSTLVIVFCVEIRLLKQESSRWFR